MAKNVADGLWEMLAAAGVRRCYGIVGDALNPVIDALRRNGSVDFMRVRNEEFGAFAAVAEACLTGQPVTVCGTAGPGVVHLINGLLDARHERAPVIAIAGDVESSLIDTEAVEELNPYTFFAAASLYTGRLINPKQLRPVVGAAITTAIAERGPTVISLPGDVALGGPARGLPAACRCPRSPAARRPTADVTTMAGLIDAAHTVAIFGGDGCARGPGRGARTGRQAQRAGRLLAQGQGLAGARQPQRGRHDRPARLRPTAAAGTRSTTPTCC